MDSLDYAQELRQISNAYLESAFNYKRERALHAEALNTLTNLIYLTGLHDNKASFENKLSMLLATEQVEVAQEFIEQLNSSKANYNGWEMVCNAYQAQISSIQSVIKFNLTGEVHNAMASKYERT